MRSEIRPEEAAFLAHLKNYTQRSDENFEQAFSFEAENSMIFYEHDLITHKSTFTSDLFERLTGYPISEAKEEPNFLFKIIPSQYLAKILAMGSKALDYIMQLPVEERKGSCMRFDFPIVKKDGLLLWIRDVCTITELDKEGKLYRSGGYIIDITNSRPKDVYSQVESFNGNILIIGKDSSVYFSTREIEILNLVNEGLASKEIALRLNISVNTVHNHRSNMMHRNNVRNMIEVLRIAKEHHLL